MKRLFLAGMMSVFVISCSKKDNTEIHPGVSDDVSTPVVKNVSGKSLIESSDCMSCHTIDERLVGPSYKEMAEKYSEKDIEMLSSKIIEGGSGNWGNVPMQAHPQISKEEAKKIVGYILTMKK